MCAVGVVSILFPCCLVTVFKVDKGNYIPPTFQSPYLSKALISNKTLIGFMSMPPFHCHVTFFQNEQERNNLICNISKY